MDFLAKLGKKPGSRGFTSFGAGLVSIGYLNFLLYEHRILLKPMVARNENMEPIEFSDDMQRLITEVIKDIEPEMKKNPFGKLNEEVARSEVKFFCSESHEPISFGHVEFKSGATIGVPYYYNMKSTEEFSQDHLVCMEPTVIPIFRKIFLDRKPSTYAKFSQEYLDSMMLSDSAKKYAIAKEIFRCDTLSPVVTVGFLFLSTMVGVMLGRYPIAKLDLMGSHLKKRIPFYLIGGSVALASFIAQFQTIDKLYTLDSEKKASNLSEIYTEGKSEYNEKLALRKAILKDMKKSEKISILEQ